MSKQTTIKIQVNTLLLIITAIFIVCSIISYYTFMLKINYRLDSIDKKLDYVELHSYKHEELLNMLITNKSLFKFLKEDEDLLQYLTSEKEDI